MKQQPEEESVLIKHIRFLHPFKDRRNRKDTLSVKYALFMKIQMIQDIGPDISLYINPISLPYNIVEKINWGSPLLSNKTKLVYLAALCIVVYVDLV